MSFSADKDKFEKFLAPYLANTEKERLIKSLSQFRKEEKKGELNYSRFYLSLLHHNYFQQGDLLREIRYSRWNISTREYEKQYTTGLVISNTCDLSVDNERDIDKEALFAPAIELKIYLDYLKQKGLLDKEINGIELRIKSQVYSNIFYLPPNNIDKNDYVVLFDQIYWFPISELNTYIDEINETRISCLHYFGHYLFLIKLSYHLCRLPEDGDRGKYEIEKKSALFFDKLSNLFRFSKKS